jgi:hypothetical protein
MAQEQTTTGGGNVPTYIAWTVTQKGDKAIWQKIGAGWPHKDGKGMTLQLDANPLDGRIVLRSPRAKPADEKGRP